MAENISYPWDIKSTPFIRELLVQPEHMDVFGHTNNVIYMSWLEEAAWAHSAHLGLDWGKFQEVNRVMVARRHEVDYLVPTFAGERLLLGTWISANDRKLRVRRSYQVIRKEDAVTVLRAQTHWVCASLDSGRPKRMPEIFVAGYEVAE